MSIKKFKRSIALLLLATTLSASIAPPRKAQAVDLVANAFTGGIVTIVFFGAATYLMSPYIKQWIWGGGTTLFGPAPKSHDRNWFGGLLLLAVGLYILDADGTQSVVFRELSSNEKQQLGITDSEQESWNSQIDQVNAIRESVEADLAKMDHPSQSDAQAVWARYTDRLDPDTVSALHKIGNAFAARANAEFAKQE